MNRLLLVVVLLMTALGCARAQLSMTGIGPGNSGTAAPLTNLRITNTGDFRVTNVPDNRAVFP